MSDYFKMKNKGLEVIMFSGIVIGILTFSLALINLANFLNPVYVVKGMAYFNIGLPFVVMCLYVEWRLGCLP